MSVSVQIGSKVRRRNDIGLDAPGSVVRLNDSTARIYWPQDNFYEELPVAELEVYGMVSDFVAA